jgi:beta-xylosidase
MDTRVSTRLSLTMIIVVTLAWAALPGNSVIQAAPTVYDYLWTDNFNATTLDPNWSWVNEDPTHWSLINQPGFMQIITQTGGVAGTTSSQKNILVREAPFADFQITTKVTINPTQNFQFAALQVFQDEDNYVQINRAYAFGNTINFDIEIAGVLTGVHISLPNTTIWFRITRQVNNYIGYYSTDGTTYTEVGRGSVALFNPKVGISAANNLSGVPEIPADFDFFELQANYPASIPTFDYTRTEDFSSTTLDIGWSWINENTSKWSLTENPGYMRLYTYEDYVGNQNVLVQPTPSTDFMITTRLMFTPAIDFQIAGLIIIQDNQNYLLLGRAYCDLPAPNCVGNGIYFDEFESGNFLDNFATETISKNEAYLRILRDGTSYSGYYSENGTDWVLMGTHTLGGSVSYPMVGITAGAGPEIPADFDFFTLGTNFLEMYMPFVTRN